MAGKSEPYHHQPFFYSDMSIWIRSCGRSGLTPGDFCRLKRPNEEGVIYYLQNGRVRGVLL